MDAVESLSIVIPCRNEGKNLVDLLARIARCSELCRHSVEIIVVDDGSSDDSRAVLADLVLSHHSLRVLRLSRNFGKESALLAGLAAAHGDLVAIMDGDLQHPPEVLFEMVRTLEETGVDQVVGVRSRSGESGGRKLASRFYGRLLTGVTDVPLSKGQGDFRVVTRRVVDAVLSLTEANRFNRGLFAWVGFPTVEFEYDDPSRATGPSRWTPVQLLGYGLDGLLSFSPRPLRFLVLLGSLLMGVFLAYVVVVIVRVIIFGVDSPGYATLIAAVFFVGGMQAFSAGLLGEYLGRIFLEVKKRPHFIVMEDSQSSNVQDG